LEGKSKISERARIMTESAKKAVTPNSSFLKDVERAGGESVSSCYQCKKCSSGCPVAFAMEIVPDRVMHMIHLGMKDPVLASNTIWICASCETCSTRCPNDIDIAKVMDTLRQMCIREGREPKEKQIPQFHEVFLKSFKGRGRVFELEMIGHGVKGRKEVKDIFKKAEEKGRR
jgi:heterodisulfide reductase subunit C